jgi:hypothetical protein
LSINEISDALTYTLGSRELTDATTDTFDQFLNAGFDSGILDELPVVGMLVKLTRAGDKLAQTLYLRNVVRLLAAVNAKTATEEQKEKLIKQLESRGELKTFGERILLILQGVDDTIKPPIIGRLIASAIREECSLDDAFRTINSVKLAFSGDFAAFQIAAGQIEYRENDQLVSTNVLTPTQGMAISSYGWTGAFWGATLGPDSNSASTHYSFYLQPIGQILLDFGLS